MNVIGIPQFKHHKHTLAKAIPIAASVGGYLLGGPVGGAIGAGVASKAQGNSWLDAVKAGGLSYAGGKIGGELLGDKLGTVGEAVNGTAANAVGPQFFDAGLGDVIGAGASNSLGANLANASIGSIAGSYAGNSLADSMVTPKAQGASGPDPFSPTRQGEAQLPSSLQAFGGLNGEQQSSNIANQGVYGSGNGPEEQSYFNNLINRRLVDDSGKTSDLSTLKPIENSYLQKLGLGGYSNSKDLLEAMSKWKAA